jgi:hypothetical protein
VKQEPTVWKKHRAEMILALVEVGRSLSSVMGKMRNIFEAGFFICVNKV